MANPTHLFRKLKSSHFKHETPLLAVGEYKPESHGEDEFSRKQAWFYTYGDEDIKEEFRNQLTELVKQRFADDDIDWDFMTLYPTHAEDEINPNLRNLVEEVAEKTGIEFKQVLKRSQRVRESHELEGEEAKLVNLEGSIKVEDDLDGKNVIIVDNISLSGISMLHGANRLKEKGADNVFGLCIGTTAKGKEVGNPEQNLTASQLL